MQQKVFSNHDIKESQCCFLTRLYKKQCLVNWNKIKNSKSSLLLNKLQTNDFEKVTFINITHN